MARSRAFSRPILAGFLLAAGLLSASMAATVGERPAVANRWNDLQFSVRRFLFFSGYLEMTRRRGRYPGEGPFHGRLLTVIETRSGASAFGAKLSTTHTTSYIDPATGATVEYIEHKLEERWKQVTLGPDGFRQVIRRPGEGQAGQPPETWPVEREFHSAYAFDDGTTAPSGVPVRDYYNMVGDLGRLSSSSASTAEYLVVAKGRVVRFRVELGEEVERPWSLVDLSGAETAMDVSLRLRRLTITPIGEDARKIGGFFAMEGGTEIWVEPETGMVVLIAGQLPGVPGRTEIRLDAASIAGKPVAEAFAN